jgi:hypothetical protein
MIRVDSGDVATLDSFALKWRWTDDRHALFPSDELSRIHPLRAEKAEEIWRLSLESLSRDFAINSQLYRDSEKAPATGDVHAWLARHVPPERPPIVVSWSAADAVLTDAELFIRRWDDFCYPASDDVSVFPLDAAWVLHYHHEEEFLYAQRRSTG